LIGVWNPKQSVVDPREEGRWWSVREEARVKWGNRLKLPASQSQKEEEKSQQAKWLFGEEHN
jgi:hypothetical protein